MKKIFINVPEDILNNIDGNLNDLIIFLLKNYINEQHLHTEDIVIEDFEGCDWVDD